MKWSYLMIYLDDLIIYGRSFSEMLDRLTIVLSRLREAGLKLKASKCPFGGKELRYLGHIISAKGIAVNSRKIDSIVKFPIPTNQTEIRSFVNLCGYYRRFVRNFAKIAAPMNELLKKDVKFEWTPKQQDAFDKLKLALVTPPILAFPTNEAKTVIHTDACGYGLGAVLCQIQDGREHVVAYASRSLNQAEKNYSTTEQ